MRKRTFAVLSLLLFTVVIISTIPHVYAATVYTAKEDGTITQTFEMGDTVRIIAHSTTVPCDIIVKGPNGLTRYKETTSSVNYDKVLSGITTEPGWWIVEVHPRGGVKPLATPEAEVTSTPYLTSYNNVVPEAPLGTISIFISFFAALGISLFRKKKV